MTTVFRFLVGQITDDSNKDHPMNENPLIDSLPNNRSHLRSSKLLALTCLLFGLGTTTGCRMCADCGTEAYPTYGGAWQRTDRENGRVGSIFDPGGSRMASLQGRTDPESADAELRKRDARGGEVKPDETEGDLERQFRESQQPKDAAEEEKALEEMEKRFENLQLEDIRKINVPADDRWN